jgi:hypothetical protein
VGSSTGFVLAGSGNDLVTFAAASLLSGIATLDGGAGTDTLALTTAAQTVSDAMFLHVINTEFLQMASGANSVNLGATAKSSGLQTILGGTGNDSFNASAYTVAGGAGFTLDGGGAATAADNLTGSSGADLFVLGNAGTTSTYYGTTTGATNYALINNLASNTLVGGASTGDRIQLNLNDYNASKYTLGAPANAGTRTTTHFGLYDNGKIVADITTAGFTVAIDGTQNAAFLLAANNHVIYV